MPPNKRSKSKRVDNDDAASAPAAPAFEVAGPALNPVPALPLADALLFGDPLPQVLHILANDSDRWKEAIVLATPFWAPMYGCLNQPIDLCVGVPSLTAASIRFDPDRELKVGSFAAQSLSRNTKSLLAIARRVRLGSRFPLISYRHLIELMPNLTAIHFGHDYVLRTASLVEYLAGIEELSVNDCPNTVNLARFAPLKSLRKLRLGRCTALTDISTIPSFTKLEEVSLGGCRNLTDVRPLGELVSLRQNSTRDPSEFDKDTAAQHVPGELLHRYAALLRSTNQEEVEHAEVMLRKIVSVDQNPWSYNADSSAEDVPVDLLDAYIKMLRSDNTADIEHGARMLCVLLEDPRFPLNPVVDTGCLSYLSSFMLRDDLNNVQASSAFIIAQLSNDADNERSILSTPNILENLIRLLDVTGCDEHATFAIGQLVCGMEGRDKFLELGVLSPLLASVRRIQVGEGDPEPTALSNSAWAISCLCKWSPAAKIDVIAPVFPVVAEFLRDDGPNVIKYGAQAIAKITRVSTDHIQGILDCGCLSRIIELLEVNNVTPHAIETLRNICRGSQAQMQAVIDGGALEKFPLMLANAGGDVQRITCEAVLAIIEKSPDALQAVAGVHVFPSLILAMKGSGKAVHEPALGVINHTIEFGSKELIDLLVANDVMACLSEIMKQRDADTLPVAKRAMEAIMKKLHAE